jgi:hypothetical protein
MINITEQKTRGYESMSASGRVVYFNGDLVPEAEAKISIYDSALMFGDMVFEMTRSFNGKQFKLKEHIEKLFVEGMSWENHGEWHIDHIKPVSKFDKTEKISIINSLDNLQPLWAVDNLKKSNKIIN